MMAGFVGGSGVRALDDGRRASPGAVCRREWVRLPVKTRCATVTWATKKAAGGELQGEDFFSAGGFDGLGMSPDLVEGLLQVGITHPTSVQAQTIPAIYGGADVVIGAATGSGKTLSYLLPIVQAMRDQEQLNAFERVPRRPRSLVMVPTRELVEQVLRVSKALSHHFKFRAVGLAGGDSSLKKQKDALASPVDLIVATPARLLQHVTARNLDLLDTQVVVLDEVDTIFEGGFLKDVEALITSIRRRQGEESKTQLVAVGATHPPTARALYTNMFPDAKYINVDLHRPPPGLTQRFIDTTPSDKTQELSALLGDAENDGSLRGGRILVFANTTDSCRFVDHFLNEKNYTTSCIHGEMPRERRIDEFQKFADQKTQILVGTDIAARGLDNLAIDHVILFDFPASPVDYIHRAGRTARAGAKGRVTSFVTKKDRTLADAVKEASREKMDTIAQAQVRRREANKRKTEEERLNRMRLKKEAENHRVKREPATDDDASQKSPAARRGRRSDKPLPRGGGRRSASGNMGSGKGKGRIFKGKR